jgi:hypothetical protein
MQTLNGRNAASLRCAACRYSPRTGDPPESCPLCGGRCWEAEPWRPFTRLRSDCLPSTAAAEGAAPMGAGSAAAKLRPRAAFRALNEQIKQLETGWASDQLHLVCECDDDRCFRPLTITPSDYERVRRDSKQFLVLPGHEPSQVAEVVEAAGPPQ